MASNYTDFYIFGEIDIGELLYILFYYSVMHTSPRLSRFVGVFYMYLLSSYALMNYFSVLAKLYCRLFELLIAKYCSYCF